jgi:hypothetical protein
MPLRGASKAFLSFAYDSSETLRAPVLSLPTAPAVMMVYACFEHFEALCRLPPGPLVARQLSACGQTALLHVPPAEPGVLLNVHFAFHSLKTSWQHQCPLSRNTIGSFLHRPSLMIND